MLTDMTETEWLECGPQGPAPMIEFLRNTHLNDRKLFLAGCAWARRFWERLGRRSQNAIEVYERLADRGAPLGDYDAAWSRFKEELDKHGDYFAFNDVNESEMDFYTALIQARAAWRRSLPSVEENPNAERDLVLPARARRSGRCRRRSRKPSVATCGWTGGGGRSPAREESPPGL